MDVPDRETLASGGCVPKLALVWATKRQISRHHIPFGDDVLDSVMHVGDDGEHPPVDVPELLDAAVVFGNGAMVENVRRHELMEDVLIILVVDLLYQPRDDSFLASADTCGSLTRTLGKVSLTVIRIPISGLSGEGKTSEGLFRSYLVVGSSTVGRSAWLVQRQGHLGGSTADKAAERSLTYLLFCTGLHRNLNTNT